MTINELRTKRAKAWEAAKAFLDSHRNENGMLSAEDDATYARMESDITNLGKEISRMERLEQMDKDMSMPVNTPITEKPVADPAKNAKTGRASDDYKKAFWNQMRNRTSAEIRNALATSPDSDGGYLVPDTFERNLIKALEDALHFRKLAHVITTSHGTHKIPVLSGRATATWTAEGAAATETSETFGQKELNAHKLTALIKVSEELLNDSAFDLESYFVTEFARILADTEEAAFFNGDGNGKPTGILNDTDGGEVGVTAASATAITADEIIRLYHSLRAPYRKRAVWYLNDDTIAAIRLLKDNNGQYMWQPGLREGAPDTLLGRPIYTSTAMPTIAANAKVIAFGDLSHYWIGDREGVAFKRLAELYAATGQVGFLSSKRVDGKLIIPEAVKILQMKKSAT